MSVGTAFSNLGGCAARGLQSTPGAAGYVLAGLAKELAWLAAHVLLYPAGLLADRGSTDDPRHRIDTLSPVSRGLILGDIEAHGTPIVLVHGFVGNRSAFAVLRRTLRRRGFGRLSRVNYSPLTVDVRIAAARLGRHIERLCAQTGYEKVHVVGHSLGGVIGRYYVQRLGGDRRVDTLVTLGSPHHGTQLARLFPLFVARQLRPGSKVITDLAAPTHCRTHFVCVWSDRDEIVIPNRSAELHHRDLDVANIRLHGIGHISLLVDYRAMKAVQAALTARGAAEPDWHRRQPLVRDHPERAQAARFAAPGLGLHGLEQLGYGSVTASTMDAAEAGWGASRRSD